MILIEENWLSSMNDVPLRQIEPSRAVALIPRVNRMGSRVGSRGVLSSGQQRRGFKQDWRSSTAAGAAVTATAPRMVAIEMIEKRILAVWFFVVGFCRS